MTEAGPWWNGGPITHFGSVNQAFCKWRQTIARYSACFPDGKQTEYRAHIEHWDAPSRKPGTDIEMLYGPSVLTTARLRMLRFSFPVRM